MTYEESLKSGHIAVWRNKQTTFLVKDIKVDDFGVYRFIEGLSKLTLTITSSRIAVNAINQMIDSARDL